ncbi:hypothetical protein GCM10009834_25850 [Streptomonospora arabica]
MGGVSRYTAGATAATCKNAGERGSGTRDAGTWPAPGARRPRGAHSKRDRAFGHPGDRTGCAEDRLGERGAVGGDERAVHGARGASPVR